MPRKKNWPPKIHHRQDRGVDFVIVNGQRITLGPHGSEEVKTRYLRVIAEAEAAGGALLPRRVADLRVSRLCECYLTYAESYYHDERQKDRVRRAIAGVVTFYGAEDARHFGGPELKAVMQAWVKEGLSRPYINALAVCVRRMFRWAVSERLCPGSVLESLDTTPGLRKGYTQAPEPDAVEPADPALVEATIPFLLPPVRAMVRLQLLTGMRPGEVILIRPSDLDRDWLDVDGVKVWLFSLDAHKNAWRGLHRDVPIGPRAQEVLAPYISRAPELYCFCPEEAVRQALAERGKAYGARRSRSPGDHYTTMTYGRAIARACERAFPPPKHLRRNRREPKEDWLSRIGEAGLAELKAWQKAHAWSPNQLRHRAGTDARVSGDGDDAQALLGHATPHATAHYVKLLEAAARLAARIG